MSGKKRHTRYLSSLSQEEHYQLCQDMRQSVPNPVLATRYDLTLRQVRLFRNHDYRGIDRNERSYVRRVRGWVKNAKLGNWKKVRPIDPVKLARSIEVEKSARELI
jgi:hypothetical protein